MLDKIKTYITGAILFLSAIIGVIMVGRIKQRMTARQMLKYEAEKVILEKNLLLKEQADKENLKKLKELEIKEAELKTKLKIIEKEGYLDKEMTPDELVEFFKKRGF